MKTVIHFVCFVLLSFTISCQSKSDKNITSENNRIVFAETISKKLLEAQKHGGYYKLNNEEATQTMVNGLNEELQKNSYGRIKGLFGDFEDMKFDALVERLINNEPFEIYRFKATFELNNDVEVRAVLNKEGKLSGFFIKPWDNKL